MKPRHAAALALGTTYLSGCLPVPWFYNTRPDIDGVVRRSEVPIAAAKVRYTFDTSDVNCNSSSEEAVSSAYGQFHFDGARSFFHIVFLLPGIAEFGSGRICFETADGVRIDRKVMLDGGTVVGSIPNESSDFITIKCDLANDSPCTGLMY
jgi:hypothetical protein